MLWAQPALHQDSGDCRYGAQCVSEDSPESLHEVIDFGFWHVFGKISFFVYILSGPFSLAVGLENVPLQLEYGTVGISNLSLISCYQPLQK